jgi:hypothetical protein
MKQQTDLCDIILRNVSWLLTVCATRTSVQSWIYVIVLHSLRHNEPPLPWFLLFRSRNTTITRDLCQQIIHAFHWAGSMPIRVVSRKQCTVCPCCTWTWPTSLSPSVVYRCEGPPFGGSGVYSVASQRGEHQNHICLSWDVSIGYRLNKSGQWYLYTGCS